MSFSYNFYQFYLLITIKIYDNIYIYRRSQILINIILDGDFHKIVDVFSKKRKKLVNVKEREKIRAY